MNKSLSLTLAALLLVSLVTPTFAEDVEVLPDVVYGHKMGMALTFDLLKPAKPNGAVVLFMVSGGWISRWFDPQLATSSDGRFGFGTLLDAGFSLAMVRHGSSPLFKVPDAVEDVRRAVRYIRHHAAELGVDAARIGVFGGSAGGHLSLMLGTAPNDGASDDGDSGDEVASASNRVAAVAAYFPPTDLRAIVGPSDRFPALDFETDKAASVSPLLHVTPDDPPTLLVHGDQDNLVPLSHSENILAAFEEHGVAAELIVLEGAGHGFQGEDAKRAMAAVTDWFSRHLLGDLATGASATTTTQPHQP